VRYLLRERLRINLDIREEVPEDEEPFIAGEDATTAVGLRLLQGLLAGRSAESLRELAEHLPELPHGVSGHRAFDQALRLAQAFETRLRSVRAEQAHHCLAVDLDVDGIRLAGELGSLHEDGQILWRFRKTGATDRLEAWVRHLVLCAASPPGVERVTQWLSPAECFHFIEVADARERLAALVGLYAEGLRRPLHFFPKSAFRYVEKGGDLVAAEKKWRVGQYNAYAESDDDYYRLAFGEAIDRVLDEEFLRLAREVFGPLLGAIREDIHAGPA
jgi:exodeoxyribonuclease V gamma subunit